MKDKILVFGKGFIGDRVQKFLECDISTRKIYGFNDAESEISKFKPTVIINCIGHTGKNTVDDCEIDKDKTLYANTFVPLILSEVALRQDIKIVHIGSGCIYDFDYAKDQPITEEKTPDFFDLFYSRSKIYFEGALSALCNKYKILIIRIRVPLDNQPHPKNLLTKLLQYKKIINIPNSVTYIPDFLRALEYLIKIDAFGIYNVVNKGSLKYPDLLEAYKRKVEDLNYEVIDYKTLNLVRTNVILSVRKLEKAGFKVRHISEVLEECVKEYIKY